MILIPHADDSGSDTQSHTFVLGALVATADEWIAFTRDWQSALDGPIKLDYFKMSEAMSFTGQFEKKRGWTDTTRNLKIADLVEIIMTRVRYGAWVSMRHADFQKHLRSIPLPQRNLSTDTPYPFLFAQFVLMLCTHAKQHQADCSFDFIFDEQVGFDQEAILWWPHLKNFAASQGLSRYIDGAPTFKDETKILPIQGADLFAWEHRVNLTRNKTLIMPPTKTMARLSTLRTVSVAFPAEGLAAMSRILFSNAADFAQKHPDTPMLAAGRKSRKLSRQKIGRKIRKASSSRKEPPS